MQDNGEPRTTPASGAAGRAAASLRLSLRPGAAAALRDVVADGLTAFLWIPADVALVAGEPKAVPFRPGFELALEAPDAPPLIALVRETYIEHDDTRRAMAAVGRVAEAAPAAAGASDRWWWCLALEDVRPAAVAPQAVA